MAQVYKMMLGTSGRQWEQLTVREDGMMMLYFHGTDRSVTKRVTLIEDGAWKGWLKSEKGSMWPGIDSGRWQAVDCPAESAEIAESAADAVAVVMNTDCTFERPRQSGKRLTPRGKKITNTNYTNYTNNEPVIVNPAPLTLNQAKPKRQRKPRKPRVERQEPLTIDHSPLTIDHSPSSTLKAIGMVAAATVALLVIYETGLLIPLGLIGLASGGLLK